MTLANDTGLHVRPATIFMQAASRYQSTIRVRKEGHTADGKSAISLMLLEAGRGSELIVEAEGSDETEAVDALVGLVESRFGDATTLA